MQTKAEKSLTSSCHAEMVGFRIEDFTSTFLRHGTACLSMSFPETEGARIELEGFKSVMPINVNSSDIIASRMLQVLLLLALVWIEILNDLIRSTIMTKINK